MAPIVSELRAAIVKGEVLVPGDAGYEESLERWSATCIKRAVSLHIGSWPHGACANPPHTGN